MRTDLIADSIPAVQPDEFLPPIGFWTRLGSMFSIGTFGIALLLVSVTKYKETVKAPATVRPAGELQLVQAAADGTIQNIHVRDNQVVKQGDVLATIDDSQLQTKRRQLRGNIQQNQQQLTEIAAQISALNTEIAAESQVTAQTIASDKAALGRNQRDYKDKQITTVTDVQQAQAALELARTELKQYQSLASTGAIAELQIAEKEADFKSALAKLKSAKTSLNPNPAPVVIADEQIAQEQAKGQATLATLNKELEDLKSTQIQIQNQFQSNRQELQQIEIELSKTSILAPSTGTVLKTALRNPGQVVHSGDEIAQISPSQTSLVIKARVDLQDISKIRVCKQPEVSDCKEGQVQLRFSAYSYPDYGILKGAVRAISPDAMAPQLSSASRTQASSTDRSSYYEVTIQPAQTYFVKSERQYPLQSGMEVRADMISREETVLTFLLRKARLLTDI